MTFVRRPASSWQLRTRTLALGERTLVMGILNVTPDSFSDGGVFLSHAAAVQQGLFLLEQGADLLDIGGESTRPGAQTISAQEEQDRILPIIEALLHERASAILSVDTYRAVTARAAVSTGAEIVNDVSGFAWDIDMPRACADLRCGTILMHAHGRPDEWGTQPQLAPSEVLPLVHQGLASALDRARVAGVENERIVLDPGYGFGKTFGNNYPLLAHQEELLALGRPLMAGLSRKSFLARTLAASGSADIPVSGRGNATLAATTAAILAGASIVRVHEVRPAVEAARIADAILASV